MTFFEYLGVWTCFDFLCSLSSIFLYVLSNQLIYFSVLSSLLLLLLTKNRVVSSRGRRRAETYTFCLPMSFAPFVMFAFSITRHLGIFSTISDSKTPEIAPIIKIYITNNNKKTKFVNKKLKNFLNKLSKSLYCKFHLSFLRSFKNTKNTTPKLVTLLFYFVV